MLHLAKKRKNIHVHIFNCMSILFCAERFKTNIILISLKNEFDAKKNIFLYISYIEYFLIYNNFLLSIKIFPDRI